MDKYIVLFDGVCNLCNFSVRFIIKRDPQKKFKFAPLQSEATQDILSDYAFPHAALDTIILIKEGILYQRSDAVLEIAKELQSFWRYAYYFKAIPQCPRDKLYNLIARIRYKLFGKKEVCMIPDNTEKDRFL